MKRSGDRQLSGKDGTDPPRTPYCSKPAGLIADDQFSMGTGATRRKATGTFERTRGIHETLDNFRCPVHLFFLGRGGLRLLG
jgi:hypothetical protein